jgi:hypothetical protein
MKRDHSPLTVGLTLMTAGFVLVMSIPVVAPMLVALLPA